jgi:DivIVA domain-containing protein
MALTPDDVVTKQFQHVRFKEGFDPEEVDDFLDEIVVEWRKTIAENEELKAKLEAYEAGEKPAGAAPAAEPAPEVEAPVAAAPKPAPVADDAGASTSAGIIELAQRLHDEHVAEGVAQRDKLVSEAEATASRIVAEAEAKQREESARLEKERQALEGRITELRQFERDYRAQLRSYIEGQLRDLETSGSTSGSTPVSAIGL